MSSYNADDKEYSDKAYRDEDVLRELYVEQRMHTQDVADALGCCRASVCRWMDRHGIEKRPRAEQLNEPWHDEGVLRKLYVEQGLKQSEVADRLGCASHTIGDWLKKYGISQPTGASGPPTPPELKDEEWLHKKYVEDGISGCEIAETLGCAQKTVYDWLGRHGIETSDANTPPPELTEEDRVRELYVGRELSTREIAERVGCDGSTVSLWLSRHGIPAREWHPFGEENPAYIDGHVRGYGPNWEEQREAALERDGYQCVVCGLSNEEHREKYGWAIHVHHIVRKEDFRRDDGTLDYERANRLNNLSTLCNKHHAKWEGIPLRPQVE